jgi:hypothetical protein
MKTKNAVLEQQVQHLLLHQHQEEEEEEEEEEDLPNSNNLLRVVFRHET